MEGSWEKIDLVSFHVIPAKAGIQCLGDYKLTGPRFPFQGRGTVTGVTAEIRFFQLQGGGGWG